MSIAALTAYNETKSNETFYLECISCTFFPLPWFCCHVVVRSVMFSSTDSSLQLWPSQFATAVCCFFFCKLLFIYFFLSRLNQWGKSCWIIENRSHSSCTVNGAPLPLHLGVLSHTYTTHNTNKAFTIARNKQNEHNGTVSGSGFPNRLRWVFVFLYDAHFLEKEVVMLHKSGAVQVNLPREAFYYWNVLFFNIFGDQQPSFTLLLAHWWWLI